MRWLISLVFVAALAIGLAVAGRYDPGYVVIVYPPWRMEIAFISFVLAVGLLILAGVVATRMALFALGLPARLRAARARRAAEKRETRFSAGLEAALEWRHADALAALADWTHEADPTRTAQARVLAARSAHALGQAARRDALLDAAEATGMKLPAWLVRLEACCEAGDFDAAQALLAELDTLVPNNPALQRRALDIARARADWPEVGRRLDLLEPHRLLPEDAVQALRARVHAEVFVTLDGGAEAVHAAWKKLPKALRTDGQVAAAAATAFMARGEDDTAVELIESAMEAGWQPTLVPVYARARASAPGRQIEHLETWLAEHPRDAALLLALAEVCRREQLWGKAQSYLEASLAVMPTPEAHVRMAELMTQKERPLDACQHYQKALALCQAESGQAAGASPSAA